MRLLALGLALGLGAVCFADRLIHIPLGKKVPRRVFRLEGDVFTNDWGSARGYLDAGLTLDFDATLRIDDIPGDSARGTIDFAYSYISPIQDVAPGLSVGVLDGANDTSDGRRYYIATTYATTLSSSSVDSFTPAEATLGLAVGRRIAPMVGVMAPLTETFRAMAEDDGFRVNAGVEMRPFPNVAVKFLFIGSSPQLGLQLRSRF